MHLTRRGYGVVAIIIGGITLSYLYGPRSLNAIVAPLVVALGAAYVQLRRAEPASVERTVPDDGFVGDAIPVHLHLESDQSMMAHVIDQVDSGLDGIGNDVETTIGSSSDLQYEVEIERRGRRTVGPVTIELTDVLGLLGKTFRRKKTDQFLAYPKVYDLAGATRYELDLMAQDALQHSREEFDRLREYDRGDSLRDVHWKSSAKRPDEDLIVEEFVAEEDLGSITIRAEATDDGSEAMASAAASLGLYFLDRGLDVGLVVPDGRLPEQSGGAHRLSLLSLLALTDAGHANGGKPGDLHVYGDFNGASIGRDGREVPFSDLVTTEFGGQRRPTIVTSSMNRESGLEVEA
ncbi:MAG: hypothetical protein ACI9PP_001037 [Halobacteriales archaeon]|jgi:uncharacterized protein (DUF58 family)